MTQNTPEQSAQETAEFKKAKLGAAIAYKEQCKIDRDGGALADYDFKEGAEWAQRYLKSQPIPSLGWVYLYERLLKTAKRATDDYFRVGDCNGVEFDMGQLMVVIKEIDEESLLPVQPDAGLMGKAIRMRDAYNSYISELAHELFVSRGGRTISTADEREKTQQAARHALSIALRPFIGTDLVRPTEIRPAEDNNSSPFDYAGREGYCYLHRRSYIGHCPICITDATASPVQGWYCAKGEGKCNIQCKDCAEELPPCGCKDGEQCDGSCYADGCDPVFGLPVPFKSEQLEKAAKSTSLYWNMQAKLATASAQIETLQKAHEELKHDAAFRLDAIMDRNKEIEALKEELSQARVKIQEQTDWIHSHC